MDKGGTEATAVAVAMTGMGNALGRTARHAGKWRKNIAAKQIRKLDYQEHLDQLCDTWLRADINSQDGLDPIEFQQAFHGHFPPWRRPVDAQMALVTLDTLFKKIDANGDGRVSWSEFSDFVLSEAMQHHQVDKVEITVFRETVYDCEYNDATVYHKDMITELVNITAIKKYVTCSRDATLRVWASKTHQHLQTIRLSEKSTTTWVMGATQALGFRSANYPFGILVVVASDRYIRF